MIDVTLPRMFFIRNVQRDGHNWGIAINTSGFIVATRFRWL